MTTTEAPKVKTFQVGRRAREGTPVPFELTWQDGDNEDHTETFNACPWKVSQMTILRAGAIKSENDTGAFLQVFEQALTGDDWERFRAIAEAPESEARIDGDLLGDIFTWLVEQATGRPTGRPTS